MLSVQNTAGEWVKTTPAMQHYARALEQDIAATPYPVFTTSDIGIPIKGLPSLTEGGTYRHHLKQDHHPTKWMAPLQPLIVDPFEPINQQVQDLCQILKTIPGLVAEKQLEPLIFLTNKLNQMPAFRFFHTLDYKRHTALLMGMRRKICYRNYDSAWKTFLVQSDALIRAQIRQLSKQFPTIFSTSKANMQKNR